MFCKSGRSSFQNRDARWLYRLRFWFLRLQKLTPGYTKHGVSLQSAPWLACTPEQAISDQVFNTTQASEQFDCSLWLNMGMGQTIYMYSIRWVLSMVAEKASMYKHTVQAKYAEIHRKFGFLQGPIRWIQENKFNLKCLLGDRL